MQLNEFQRGLGDGKAYVTDPGAARGLGGLLGRSDVWFYARIVWVIIRYAIVARLGRFTPRAWSRSSFAMVKAYEASGARIHIHGAHHLLTVEGPVVYAANHMSVAETILLPCILLVFSPLTVVVKRSLLRYPGFGTILRSVDPVSVSRDNPREDFKLLMEEGGRCLAGGRSLLVFPQAHRRTTFDPATFNTSAVKLAKRAGVPIVPVAIRTDWHGIGARIKEFGRIDRTREIHFSFGEPRRVDGGGDREVHAGVIQFIAGELARLGVVVERETSTGGTPSGRMTASSTPAQLETNA